MRNIILNPTKRQVHKINKRIEKSLSSATEKQALIVFTTNIGHHPIYKISLSLIHFLHWGQGFR